LIREWITFVATVTALAGGLIVLHRRAVRLERLKATPRQGADAQVAHAPRLTVEGGEATTPHARDPSSPESYVILLHLREALVERWRAVVSKHPSDGLSSRLMVFADQCARLLQFSAPDTGLASRFLVLRDRLKSSSSGDQPMSDADLQAVYEELQALVRMALRDLQDLANQAERAFVTLQRP
jgi:hypothetical protein